MARPVFYNNHAALCGQSGCCKCVISLSVWFRAPPWAWKRATGRHKDYILTYTRPSHSWLVSYPALPTSAPLRVNPRFDNQTAQMSLEGLVHFVGQITHDVIVTLCDSKSLAVTLSYFSFPLVFHASNLFSPCLAYPTNLMQQSTRMIM